MGGLDGNDACIHVWSGLDGNDTCMPWNGLDVNDVHIPDWNGWTWDGADAILSTCIGEYSNAWVRCLCCVIATLVWCMPLLPGDTVVSLFSCGTGFKMSCVYDTYGLNGLFCPTVVVWSILVPRGRGLNMSVNSSGKRAINNKF